jgi:hypothetical protein
MVMNFKKFLTRKNDSVNIKKSLMGVQNKYCSLKTKQPNNNKLSENFLLKEVGTKPE